MRPENHLMITDDNSIPTSLESQYDCATVFKVARSSRWGLREGGPKKALRVEIYPSLAD